MSNISNISGEKRQNQSLSTNEVELTDVELGTVHGGEGHREGHHGWGNDRGGPGWGWGGGPGYYGGGPGYYGGGYGPAYGPAYGSQPEIIVIDANSSPAGIQTIPER